MDPADKARENRLRRAAERQGFKISKGRTTDPRAVAYGFKLTHGRKITRCRDLDELAAFLGQEQDGAE